VGEVRVWPECDQAPLESEGTSLINPQAPRSGIGTTTAPPLERRSVEDHDAV